MGTVLNLPISAVFDAATIYQEISPPIKRHPYGSAHAFLAEMEGYRVIGSGSLVDDQKLVVHGLSTGNYRNNIEMQLKKYPPIPDGGQIDDECVLVWGDPNFGHWVITYLLRMPLLKYRDGIDRLPLLISKRVPRKYLDWLRLMGYSDFLFADDGVLVKDLWVPSVLCYRGHYEDMHPYIYSPAVHALRSSVLHDKIHPRQPRTRLYISRAKADWRRLENESELMVLMDKHGIRRVFMEEMSVMDQIELVSRAELIVVHFGGGSPITMFAPEDCTIIEISAPKIAGTFGSQCWAHVLGQDFMRVDAIPTRQTGKLHIDWDAIVPVQEIEKCLETLSVL